MLDEDKNPRTDCTPKKTCYSSNQVDNPGVYSYLRYPLKSRPLTLLKALVEAETLKINETNKTASGTHLPQSPF